MRWLKMYDRFIRVFVKGKMEYHNAFFFELIANFIYIGIYFAGIFVLFQRFSSIGGWNFYEVLFLFTTNWLSYSISSFFLWEPMKNMGALVKSGEFDSCLFRPISPLPYMVCRQFQYTFFPRLIFAVIFYAYSLKHIVVKWMVQTVSYVIINQISSFFIYSAIFVITGAVAFWWTDSEQITSLLTSNDYGLRVFTDYPISVFPRGVRVILTFIFPYAFGGYYQAAYLLGKRSVHTQSSVLNLFNHMVPYLSIVFAILFCFIAKQLWSCGRRRYSGSGS